MRMIRSRAGKIVLALLGIALLGAMATGLLKSSRSAATEENENTATKTEASPKEPVSPESAEVELVKGKDDSLLVPTEVRQALGMRKGDIEQVAVAAKPTHRRALSMPGSTALDPARLIRVRVRFAPAEVVEIGKIVDPHSPVGSTMPPAQRELQAGDTVKKGDLLAVLSSADVGNKKNDLFDALSQLRLDEDVLKRAETRSAAVPEVFLLSARRNVEADLNAVNRAENTLKTWGIPDKDIDVVRKEVRSFASVEKKRAVQKEKLSQWARVELRAADEGVLIEQNVALHETVVDNTTNLFQIAQVDPLVVLAAVPEDDLPALQMLKTHLHGGIRWNVRTVGSDTITGYVDDIGYLIDPNQHTAVVRGHILNPKGLLRAGQFVTATVDLLPPEDVVEVPISAVVEDGNDSVVFVQPNPEKPIYSLRRVEVTHRFEHTAYIRSVLAVNDKDADEPGEEDAADSAPIKPLLEGERVLTVGVLELKAVLADKLAEVSSPPPSKVL